MKRELSIFVADKLDNNIKSTRIDEVRDKLNLDFVMEYNALYLQGFKVYKFIYESEYDSNSEFANSEYIEKLEGVYDILKDDLNKLGYSIKSFREQHELTQEQFAKLINKSKTTVQSLEKGDLKPSNDTLNKIEKVLGMKFERESGDGLSKIIGNDIKCRRAKKELNKVRYS